VIVTIVLASLATSSSVRSALIRRPEASVTHRGGLHGILQSAGLLFFAFASARIATLGGGDRSRSNDPAIPIALGIARRRDRGDSRIARRRA
jgi:APA family basic amino acid/polyamine antiporter